MKRTLAAFAITLSVSIVSTGTAFAQTPADQTGDSVEAPKKNKVCIDLEWLGVPKELLCFEWPI